MDNLKQDATNATNATNDAIIATKKLLKNILFSDEHGHAIIDGEDKEAFLAAGWIFAGTVSKDALENPLVRMRKP